jgi:hypothetical protein
MENNFPHGLAIRPSVDAHGLYDEHFIELQESAIRSSGIAGRLWCEDRRVFREKRGVLTKKRRADREAAYLMKDYVDPRDDTVEHDPPPPWRPSSSSRHVQPAASACASGPDPHIVVELGAGLGAVGFAIAENLQKRWGCGASRPRRTSRSRDGDGQEPEPEPKPRPGPLEGALALEGALLTAPAPLPDVVVLTDLEDVCDKLLNPNLSHKASLWSSTRTRTHTGVQMQMQTAPIRPREWRGRSTPTNRCGGVPLEYEYEYEYEHQWEGGRAMGVEVAIRPLAWGSVQHVESLAGTLMPYQKTSATFTIICSDLVRTSLVEIFPIPILIWGLFFFFFFFFFFFTRVVTGCEGVLPAPSGASLTYSHSPNVSFAIPVRPVSVVDRPFM